MGLIGSWGLIRSSQALFELIPKFIPEGTVLQTDIDFSGGSNWYPSGQLQPAASVQSTIGVE